MSIQELGAVGEFLGFFAILVTLVYLSVQTKISQRTMRTQSSREVINDFQTYWSELQNPSTASVIRRAVNDWDSLTNNDQMIAHSFFVGLIIHLASALEVKNQVPELENFVDAWEDNVMGFLQTPGGAKWWSECEYVFLDIARERIKLRMADRDNLPPSWTETMSWWNLDDHD